MTIDALKSNLSQIKEIIREMYVFTGQLASIKNLETNSKVLINSNEKKLLTEAIEALSTQLKILNDSIPGLIDMIKFYKELESQKKFQPQIKTASPRKEFIQIKYQSPEEKKEITLAINKRFKKDFIENLSKSNLSINQLKKKYSRIPKTKQFGKPNLYAKISNRIFRDISKELAAKDYLNKLNRDLRKINSPFLIRTYTSVILFSCLLGLIAGIILFTILLFFNLSVLFPFISSTDEAVLIRAFKFFWVIFLMPILTGLFLYFYPSMEAKTIGSKIDQELPFVTIHMSAIASSGIEPISIFKILLKSSEYKYTNQSFRKIMNLINFHGLDLVTALKHTSRSSPSAKLRELLEGMATSITTGGDLHIYLNNRSERLLFDYKLEREKYTKTSETFMNIYISVVIAAPMIFLMLFVIIGGTGLLTNFIGLDINTISILIILIIVLLNIGFLFFLKLKQPLI